MHIGTIASILDFGNVLDLSDGCAHSINFICKGWYVRVHCRYGAKLYMMDLSFMTIV